MPMADCTSERRNRLRRSLSCGRAVIAALAVLTPAVYAAGKTSAASGSAEANAKVSAVRFWSLGDLTRISVEVSSDFKYRSERLNDPDRLFFDIQGAKPAISEKRMHVVPVGDALVKQIRVAETQPGVTRVVLDLETHNPPVTFTASQLSNPDRLVIEIKRKDQPAPPLTGSVSGAKALTDSNASAAGAFSELAPDLTPAKAVDVAPSSLLSHPEVAIAKPAPRRFVPPPAAPRPLPVLRMTVLEPPELAIPQGAPLPLASLKITLPAQRITFAAPSAAPAPRTSSLPSFASLTATSYPGAPAAAKVAPLPVTGPPAPNTASLTSSVSSFSAPPAENLPLVELGAPIAAPSPSPESPILGPPTRDAVAAKTGSAAVPSLTRVLGLKLGRVVIDAGHGGHDAGTHGVTGLLEKDVVLDVALRVGALLQERLGSEVIYTRNDDTYIPLEERTQIANEHKADLFLSIHANSSPYKTVAGVETYYLNFTTTKSSLDLAAKENAGSQSSIFDLKDVLAKIAMHDKIDESREFANNIQNSLFAISAKNNAAVKNRGIKKAPFVVLIGASMPSVLAEIGFLTNPSDEALLRKPEQRQKIAEALYKGVASYAESLSHFQVAKRN